MTRYARRIEWVLEPVDVNEDIIDPWHYKTEREARAHVDVAFKRFPEAVRVDMARCTRTGNDDEGEVKRDYDYRATFAR